VRCTIHNSDVWKRSTAIATVMEERSYYITRQWWKIARQLTGSCGQKSITIFNWLVNRGVCAAVCSLDNLKRWLRINYNVSRSVIHPTTVPILYYCIHTTLFLSFFLFLKYRWARPLTVRSIADSHPLFLPSPSKVHTHTQPSCFRTLEWPWNVEENTDRVHEQVQIIIRVYAEIKIATMSTWSTILSVWPVKTVFTVVYYAHPYTRTHVVHVSAALPVRLYTAPEIQTL